MSQPGLTATARPLIRTVVDSRPAAETWVPPVRLPTWQPMLVGLGAVDDPASQSAETRGRLVDVPGGCAPPPGLPDPCEWAAVLALAVAEVVTGQRSPSQLGRWLDDAVMTELRFAARRHRHPEARPRTVATTSVASVRVQCPAERAVEATAHLRIGRRSAAIAFRLEVFGERWLCTALELGPRPTR